MVEEALAPIASDQLEICEKSIRFQLMTRLIAIAAILAAIAVTAIGVSAAASGSHVSRVGMASLAAPATGGDAHRGCTPVVAPCHHAVHGALADLVSGACISPAPDQAIDPARAQLTRGRTVAPDPGPPRSADNV